jgi:hypothetical protein
VGEHNNVPAIKTDQHLGIQENSMRFMVIVKATEESESGALPDPELAAQMGKFNEEMAKAGILLAAEGLQASSKGARVRSTGGKRTVIDGPFAETKELVAGFWILQVRSKEEAIEWVKRCPEPFKTDWEIEIRQVWDMEDFQGLSEETIESEERLRTQLSSKS